ncbi:hypothetical protein DSUL_90015 [Desulfovibrionales bacterium]
MLRSTNFIALLHNLPSTTIVMLERHQSPADFRQSLTYGIWP